MEDFKPDLETLDRVWKDRDFLSSSSSEKKQKRVIVQDMFSGEYVVYLADGVTRIGAKPTFEEAKLL